MGTKICKGCKRELPLDEIHFYRNRNTSDGYENKCKVCRGGQYKETRKEYPTKENYKRCKHCGQEKHISHFRKSKSSNDGYKPICKECSNDPNIQIMKYIDNTSKMKICTKCKRELPANTNYFNKHRWQKDGLYCQCKECRGYKFTINKVEVEEGMKVCRKCQSILPATKQYFLEDKRVKDGLFARCRVCTGGNYQTENNDVPDGYKICTVCKHIFPKTEEYFYKCSSKYDRFYSSCKQCTRKKLKHKNHIFAIKEQKRKALKKSLPHNLTAEQWKAIKKEFNNQCCYCGKKDKKLTQEHFIPLTKGGEYTINNIIPACKSCNSSKNNKDFFDWYPKQPFYSKEREQKILDYLGYNEQQSISI